MKLHLLKKIVIILQTERFYEGRKMSNPYAKIFHDAFVNSFINEQHKQEGAVLPEKMQSFMRQFNAFLYKFDPKNYQKIETQGYKIEPKEFEDFVLSLRALMIAKSREIPVLSEKETRSADMVAFFDMVKNFCVQNSSKIFSDFDYDCFVRDKDNNLDFCDNLPDYNQKNVFFFGVNRSDCSKMDNVNYFFHYATKDLFKQKEFLNISIYSVCMPITFPEEISASTILKTINQPQKFLDADRYFVEEYWSSFVGENLEFDEEGKVVGGKAYSPEKMEEKLKNLKIFSYCMGAANAHRCLNALKNVAYQLYDKTLVDHAWKNIDVVSYAFLLESEKVDYHNISLFCNDKNPNNPETVLLTNFPTQYHNMHLLPEDKSAIQIQNKENCKYIALELPKSVSVYNHSGQKVSRNINNRNGHRLQNVTAKNSSSHNFEVLLYIGSCLLKDEEINDKKLFNIANYNPALQNGKGYEK